jgi:hypothetical protein
MARDAYFVKAVTSLDSRVFVIDTPSVRVVYEKEEPDQACPDQHSSVLLTAAP